MQHSYLSLMVYWVRHLAITSEARVRIPSRAPKFLEFFFFSFLKKKFQTACRKLTDLLEQNCLSKYWSVYFKDHVSLVLEKRIFWTVSSTYILLCGLPLNNILPYFIVSSPFILSRCLGNGILQPSSKMIHHRDWNSICHQFLWFHNASK